MHDDIFLLYEGLNKMAEEQSDQKRYEILTTLRHNIVRIQDLINQLEDPKTQIKLLSERIAKIQKGIGTQDY